MERIKVGIIGCGRWGFNHVRTAHKLVKEENIVVCDFNPASEEKVRTLSDTIKFTTNVDDVLKDDDINAVIVATPAETHYQVTKDALEAGKNVLVEKPITLYSGETKELIEIAEKGNLKLMVGHVLLYHPAVKKIKECIDNGKIGNLQYIYSNRVNLGALRTEENILWSFAPHDISIIQYLTESFPNEVHAHGAIILQSNIEDTTLTYLNYPGNVNAHIYVSWLHPFKEQRLIVVGSKGMFVFEDTLKTEKLKYFPKGFKNINGTFEKFDGDYEVVEFETKMPLNEEQMHFYNSIINDTKPLTDGRHAMEVLRILEMAQEKLPSAKLNV